MLNSKVLGCLWLCCWTYLHKLDKNESHKVKINEQLDCIKSCSVTKSYPILCNPMDCSMLLKRQTKWGKAVIEYKRKGVRISINR